MPVYKDKNKGTWFVVVRYTDWKGDKKMLNAKLNKKKNKENSQNKRKSLIKVNE